MEQINENNLEREVSAINWEAIKNKLPNMRLLIVEDDKDYIASYKFALERQCKTLDIATNERDGLGLIAEKGYDAVITDGAMPRYYGAHFLDHGNTKPEDYRGKNIAKAAKEEGAYVIGISAEPEKLDCESIDVLMKKPYDVLKLFEVLALQPTREEFNTNIAERRYE